MKCKTVHKKLIFYIDSELSHSENEEIGLHLETCNECLHLYNELNTSYKLIGKQEKLAINPFLYTRIRQKLDDIEKAEKLSIQPVYVRILQPVAIVFFLFIGISAGIFLGNSYNAKTQLSNSNTTTNEIYINELSLEKLEVNLLNDKVMDN